MSKRATLAFISFVFFLSISPVICVFFPSSLCNQRVYSSLSLTVGLFHPCALPFDKEEELFVSYRCLFSSLLDCIRAELAGSPTWGD